MAQPRTTEVFRPGDTAPMSGEYAVVDAEGNETDYDTVTLDEGDRFPDLVEEGLCYRLFDSDEDIEM